jgi:hypothetical protein
VTTTLEDAIAAVRGAVTERMENTPADDPKMRGYSPLAGCQPAQECAAQVLADAWRDEGCCDGGRCQPKTIDSEDLRAFADRYFRQTGDGVMGGTVHPTSQAYFDLLDTLRQLHISKSRGYGCPDGTDPLLNIRRGAEFVGIKAWQGAMVRLSDKVTRLSVFNKTGNLPHESVEDTLMDLASYSLLALLLYREERT